MSLPRYPEYKDSGVEWLGKVPAHWRVVPLGRVTRSRCDGPFGSGLKSEHYTDNGVRVVRLQNIRCDGFDGTDEAFVDLSYYRAELTGHDVVAGDVLIAGLGDDNNTVGRACVAPNGIEPAMVKADCFRFRLNQDEVHTAFVAVALTATATLDAGRLSTGSTRSRIPLSVMATRKLALPPLAEQAQIAEFLDRETAKIDALVAEQQQLIELLKEKRQAVISHAVTKGLNPNAPMKDSGIEWLGEVPAHWACTRLRALFRQQKRQDQVGKAVLSVYRDYGIIAKDSRDDNINKTPEDISAYQLVNPEDLVVNKMKAWQGSLGISMLEGVTSPDYLVFAPHHRESPRFLHLLLRARRMVSVYRSISNGIRPDQWRLESDSFLGLPVFLPPLAEQEEIVAFLRRENAHAEELSAEAQHAVELLQERRTALISVAVTGQIDVRPTTATT